ncbi:MAG: tetratricopeptide repeat protein [Acidobacteriia bacterium]|nr:tetratricopeptide repeat protein [Terriglobia bacterium]
MRFLAVFVTFVLAAFPARAGWLRLRGTKTELVTDAGEKEGLRALARLEQIRAVMPGASDDSGRELRVVLFDSEKEFREYAKSETISGLYQSGLERDYIVTYAGSELPRVVTHEFVHFLLNQTPAPLPRWFEEGTAELYSNTQVNNKRVRIGKEIEPRMKLLLARPWLSARQMAAERPAAPEREQDVEQAENMFYAESWALVHMLNLSPNYRDHLPQFITLLAQGTDAAEAFRTAFGRDFARALAELPGYLKKVRSVKLGTPPPTPFTPPKSELLSDVDALLLRADISLRRGLAEQARSLFEQAAREHPDSATAQAGLGMLAMTQNRPGDARRYLEKAIQLDDKDATILFEYALLERDAGAGNERVRELLEKVVGLNPNFGEAQLLLGVRATDDGRYDRAVVYLHDAARLLPRQSYVWHALAYAQQKLGNYPDALDAAQRAVRTASTDEQEHMAEALRDALRDQVLGKSVR